MRPRAGDQIHTALVQRFDHEERLEQRAYSVAIEERVGDAALVAIERNERRVVDSPPFAESGVPSRAERREKHSSFREMLRRGTYAHANRRGCAVKEPVCREDRRKIPCDSRKRRGRLGDAIVEFDDGETRRAQRSRVATAPRGKVEDANFDTGLQAFDEALGQWMGRRHSQHFRERPNECLAKAIDSPK